ncbi:ImmA/IrrE family metallo-endopeptidase [Candidatus Daviesbacteria bacterium]|nr:ImmA/IrrE family metallo-endopeptidase [Candidatus Daviesbacteria bacterium]
MSSSNRIQAQTLLKSARILEAPVDVEKIAKILGFTIIPFPFPEKRKGMVLIENGVKAIGVNEKHPVTLQRYTIGHELGHFINGHAHFENAFIEDETIFYDHHFQQEREADSFAAELLMPKDFLENDLALNRIDESQLLGKYLVSKQALWVRLNTLRLAEKYSYLRSS